MNSHRLRIAAAACASALLLAACGGGDDDTSTIADAAADATATATVEAPTTTDDAAAATDTADPQAVVDVYKGAFAAGNPTLACMQLTEAAKQHVADNQSAESCEVALGLLHPGLSKGWIADYEAAEIGPVEVDGETATVTVPQGYQGGLAAPQHAVLQDGAWKLAFEPETP